MTRHYSTGHLFWQTPNAYLASYFVTHEVLQYFEFEVLKETKVDAVGDRSASDSSP